MKPVDFLIAARVPESLRPRSFGVWHISREDRIPEIARVWVGWSSMTVLRKVTLATLMQCSGEKIGGEVVMEDSLRELSRHLPIWLAAHGRILVTGLGLGCVVRGLLANPDIKHIDVIEIDAGIIRVVGAEFSANPRVTIIHGDALKIDLPGRWDFAWHDIHASDDQPHLQILHGRLIKRFWNRVGLQGAWMLPRIAKKIAPRILGAARTKLPVGFPAGLR